MMKQGRRLPNLELEKEVSQRFLEFEYFRSVTLGAEEPPNCISLAIFLDSRAYPFHESRRSMSVRVSG